MRSTILTIAGILLLSATTVRAEIPWNENLRTAHQQAEQEGKLLLLHFYTDNCHWCDKLEAGAFQSPQLSAAIEQHYIPVKIDAGKNPTLAKTFKVSRFPTDVIISTDGTVLAHGVSPQAPQDYVGLLARYSGQAPAASEPMSPATNTQIAAAPTPGYAAPQTMAATAPPQAYAAAPQGDAAAAPVGSPAPQINQFAMQPQRPAQANPYAPQVPNQPPYRGFEAPEPQPSPAAAQLSMPTANLATAPAAEPTSPTFSLPPGMPMGVPAQTVGHRTAGMTLEQPAQVAAPAPSAAIEPFAADAFTANEFAAEDQPPAPAASQTNEPPALAMQGYCPVAVLDQGEWIAGNPQNGLIHLGQLYLFSSPEAMETFRNDPEIYTPVMNGMDVVLFFEERRLVQGSREWGVTDPDFNRMFFFANEETMNHFNQEHARYTRSAIEVTRQAAAEANVKTR